MPKLQKIPFKVEGKEYIRYGINAPKDMIEALGWGASEILIPSVDWKAKSLEFRAKR